MRKGILLEEARLKFLTVHDDMDLQYAKEIVLNYIKELEKALEVNKWTEDNLSK